MGIFALNVGSPDEKEVKEGSFAVYLLAFKGSHCKQAHLPVAADSFTEQASSGFWHRLNTSGSAGILQAVSARLGL